MSYQETKGLPLSGGWKILETLDKKKQNILEKSITGPAPIVSFDDGGDNLPMDMEIDIKPVQDLHGYDYPWPAGGGKNLFNKDDNTIVLGKRLGLNGQETVDADYFIGPKISVTVGETYTKNSPNADVYHRLCAYNSSDEFLEKYDSTNTVTIGSDISYIKFCGLKTELNTTQFEKGSSSTSFATYSNICPISGWTGAKVERTGHNLVDENAILDATTGWTIDSDGFYTGLNSNTNHSISLTPNITFKEKTRYTISVLNRPETSNGYVNFRVHYTDGTTVGMQLSTNPNATVKTIYTTQEGKTLKKVTFGYYYITGKQVWLKDFQIEEGTNATDYVPYIGAEEYEITFPAGAGTVYGGTLTVNKDGSGELVVTHKCIDLGDKTWTYYGNYDYFRSETISDMKLYANMTRPDWYCEQYDVANVGGESGWGTYHNTIGQRYEKQYLCLKDERYTDGSLLQQALSGIHLVYELATPVTYSLTPGQVKTLLGVNNVWADTGDILKLDYQTDEYINYAADDSIEKVKVIPTKADWDEKIVSEKAAVASFTAESDDLPISVKMEINPVQDLHGYDYPWPAGGGKNLFDVSAVTISRNRVIDGTTGQEVSNQYYDTSSKYEVLPNTTYAISGDTLQTQSFAAIAVAQYTSDDNYIQPIYSSDTKSSNRLYGSFTTDANCKYIRISLCKTASDTALFDTVQLELGSTATTYAPYSNICPISGWTGANVTRTGKNLYSGGDGNSTKLIRKDIDPIPAGTYTISGILTSTDTDSTYCCIQAKYVDESDYIYLSAVVERNNRFSLTVIFTKSVDAIRILASTNLSKSTGDTVTCSDMQIEKGSVATSYEPFGATYLISWKTEAGTVYGGTAKWNKDGSVELTADVGIANASDLTWTYDSTNQYFYTAKSDAKRVTTNTVPEKLISNIYASVSMNNIASSDYVIGLGASTNRLYIKDSRYTSNEQVQESGAVIVYPLATPIPITLSASQVKSLLGLNNVWADTGDILEVHYGDKISTKTDLQLTHGLISNTEKEVATANHAVDDIFICNGRLCKVTSSIAVGESIVEGTNIEYTTVIDLFNSIVNRTGVSL